MRAYISVSIACFQDGIERASVALVKSVIVNRVVVNITHLGPMLAVVKKFPMGCCIQEQGAFCKEMGMSR